MSSSDDDLSAVRTDFGAVVEGVPDVLVRPVDVADAAVVVRFAADRDLPITVRGGGHSQGGQSVAPRGIVLDTSRLDSLGGADDREGTTITVGAGALWGDVLQRTSAHRRTPPVITSHPWVSVGGTHSVGGIGVSSFRSGSQAANCIALEVVLGTGDVVRCSPTEEGQVFRHALCGLGQFGVLTEAAIAVRPHRRLVRSEALVYDDVDGFLRDLHDVAEDEHTEIDYLDAFLAPHPHQRGWLFVLRASTEVDDDVPVAAAAPAPHARRRVPPSVTSFEAFWALPPAPGSPAPPTGTVQPWTDVFMPWEGAGTAILDAAAELPSDITCRFALRPFRPDPERTPLLRTPPGQTCLGFGAFPVAPVHRSGDTTAAVDRLLTRLIKAGGIPYRSGYGTVRRHDQISHSDAATELIKTVKQRCDPGGILNPAVGYLPSEAMIR